MVALNVQATGEIELLLLGIRTEMSRSKIKIGESIEMKKIKVDEITGLTLLLSLRSRDSPSTFSSASLYPA